MAVKIKQGSAASLLNLTPMIDVVFQLLLFFLVASKFADEEREIEVTLPQASEARPITAKPKELFVNVDSRGQLFVSGRVVTEPELDGILRQAAANNPGRQSVIIRADKRVPFQHVVVVMNSCNKAGIRDYTVTTEQSTGS